MSTLLGLPGKEKREKSKKQEIRRVHNSNPLQLHSHVLFQAIFFCAFPGQSFSNFHCYKQAI